jgi:hypothetical protein
MSLSHDREILRWLSPSNNEPIYYQDRYQELLTARCEATCLWLFQQDVYDLWALPDVWENILWIRGDPGVGKSTLAATAIEALASKGRALYFFFDARGNDRETSEATAMLRSLVYQLSQTNYEGCATPKYTSLDPRAMRIVETAFQRSGQERASRFDMLWELFVSLLCISPITYLVVDGLDECSDRERLIRRFLELDSRGSLRLKVLLSSRLTEDLADLLEGISTINVSASLTEEDINRFIDLETGNLSTMKSPLSSATIRHVARKLTRGAGGMYVSILECLCL